MIDYLLHCSALRGLLPSDHVWQATTISTTRSKPRLLANSQKFLADIQAPTASCRYFSLVNSIIFYGDRPLATLSAREFIIMSKLIEHAPAPVTIDELADLIFLDSAKFSLSALTKCIERLRRKLEDMGISRHHLATASGIGYYLKR